LAEFVSAKLDAKLGDPIHKNEKHLLSFAEKGLGASTVETNFE